MLATDRDYQHRTAQGRDVEAKILAALMASGVKLSPASADEDIHQKVDAWIVDKYGKKHSLQIKFRETGDDIIFEIIKDMDKKIQGRDWGMAEYYFVLDRHRTGRLFLTSHIKDKALEINEIVLKDLSVNPSMESWEGNGWEAKIRIDRAHGQRKLMAYMSPRLFEIVREWPNMNVF